MSRGSEEWVHRRRGWVAVSVGGVLVWRAAAYYAPSTLVTIPDRLHLPLALLGVLFVVSSVGAWSVRPNRWTRVFLVYGLCMGIHWGGAVGVGDPSLDMALFFVYLAFTAMGDAALLNLALIYPSGSRLAPSWRAGLYAPAALALLLAPIAAYTPNTILESAGGLILLVANLFSITAGIVFLVHAFAVAGATRRAARLSLIVTAMVSGSLVALLGAGGVLPGVPEAWNLALGVVPIALAVALVSESL